MTCADLAKMFLSTLPAFLLALTALLAELRHWRRK